MIASVNRILLAGVFCLGGAVNAMADDALSNQGALLSGSGQTTVSFGHTTALESRLTQLINGRTVAIRSKVPPSFGFQGQCTIDDDCGTWKCCDTSCEDVDVCP